MPDAIQDYEKVSIYGLDPENREASSRRSANAC